MIDTGLYQVLIVMIDKVLIEKKLRRIEEFQRELKSVNINNLSDFKKDIIVKRFIERDIELSIEQMVNVCKHLISALDLKEPETYDDCFDILSGEDMIPLKFVDIFKSMVRFRNILIHAYHAIFIDNPRIYHGIFN